MTELFKMSSVRYMFINKTIGLTTRFEHY